MSFGEFSIEDINELTVVLQFDICLTYILNGFKKNLRNLMTKGRNRNSNDQTSAFYVNFFWKCKRKSGVTKHVKVCTNVHRDFK